MARDYAQIRQDMWSDDRWRGLTPMAQWLYMLLLSDPRLTYAGVTDWHPGKLSQRAKECGGRDVLIAAAELSDDHFIVVDEETEEVMIRSYLKHDPLMRNPRLAVTMAKDFGAVASNKIRAAIVWELQRLKKAEPDLPAWEKPQVKTVLRQNAVNPREMVTDPQVEANSYIADLEDSAGTAFKLVSAPVQFDEQPGDVRRAPDHGEHTDEVLQELGLTMDEILEYKISGAVL